jgi:hypothetical protein
LRCLDAESVFGQLFTRSSDLAFRSACSSLPLARPDLPVSGGALAASLMRSSSPPFTTLTAIAPLPLTMPVAPAMPLFLFPYGGS